ncbi:hypothetical protein F3Y22_tig00111022pilonHSYRG00396 [Hibiscus syriacus]|uniref:Folate receptor-like domain-containing protein n=1 Tax=Hibiscus syriacus TaxID=106335 RepID=A0A6A2Z5J3_HIBSY|nr:hypothetical protein F3Y22_tig00111022pilonHSYRG00396 [Hibiscus syriacus]
MNDLLRETVGVCVSQGGSFPPFSSEGKPPKRVGKGHKDLTLWEACQECLHLWELLECSICDTVFQSCSNAYFSMDANTQLDVPLDLVQTQKLCRGWLPSCPFPSFEVLAPCGVNDFVCGKASEWTSNGTELCLAAGFGVKQSVGMHGGDEEASCYGGRASLDSIADSWGASRTEKPHRTGNSGLLEDFQQWLQDMPSNERVSWAVGGLVLTAGLLFIRFNHFLLLVIKFSSRQAIYFLKFYLASRSGYFPPGMMTMSVKVFNAEWASLLQASVFNNRKSQNHCQKLAAIQRTARRLEGKMNQTAPSSS